MWTVIRHSQAGQPAYRSRQSINSPGPGGTDIDLLVMRERPRRGIRNSGYDVSRFFFLLLLVLLLDRLLVLLLVLVLVFFFYGFNRSSSLEGSR